LPTLAIGSTASGEEIDILCLLPDEVLLQIFKQLDGKSLACANQVNRRLVALIELLLCIVTDSAAHRWYAFVKDYSQELFKPLCVSNDWNLILSSRTGVEPTAAATIAATEADAELDWQLVYASHAAVQQFWTQGQFVNATPSKLRQRRLFVPMTMEAWGAALDQF
jgi:hypothetical protein